MYWICLSPLMIILERLGIFRSDCWQDSSAFLLTPTCCTSLGVAAGIDSLVFGQMSSACLPNNTFLLWHLHWMGSYILAIRNWSSLKKVVFYLIQAWRLWKPLINKQANKQSSEIFANHLICINFISPRRGKSGRFFPPVTSSG